jgi:hypothetical protein
MESPDAPEQIVPRPGAAGSSPAAADVDDVAATLDALGARPAGSDAERLGALALAQALAGTGRRAADAGRRGAAARSVTVEPVWVRPRWELALALYVAVGIAGSVVAVSAPAVGAALALLALLALALDTRGWFLLRWLTPARATQNVVATSGAGGAGRADAGRPADLADDVGAAAAGAAAAGAAAADAAPAGAAAAGATSAGATPAGATPAGAAAAGAAAAGAAAAAAAPRTRVILTAHCDTPRGGLARSRWVRRLATRRVTLGLGPLGWLALVLTAVAACAAAREAGASGAAVGAVQLVPTLALIAALAVLVDGALARPAAGDATAAATVVALARVLDATPPRQVAVDVVIGGAGSAQALGFLAHLRAHRPSRTSTVVVEVSACRTGTPAWWTADGSLLPLRYHPRLAALATGIAADERHLRAEPHRTRDLGAALRARQRRLPAIRIGCPASDASERADPAAAAAAVELGLALIHALDAELAA